MQWQAQDLGRSHHLTKSLLARASPLSEHSYKYHMIGVNNIMARVLCGTGYAVAVRCPRPPSPHGAHTHTYLLEKVRVTGQLGWRPVKPTPCPRENLRVLMRLATCRPRAAAVDKYMDKPVVRAWARTQTLIF